MPKALSVELINDRIKSEGYVCISYDVKTKVFTYKCSNGHIGKMRMDHWRRGVRCSKCVGNRKLTFDEVKNIIESEGYTLLSNSYINNKTKLTVKCPKNHIYKVTYNNWKSGNRCPECSSTYKKNIHELYTEFDNEGYKLLTTKYINNKQLLECICPNNHLYKVSFDNFSNKNSRCPKCNNVGISNSEKELRDFVSTLVDSDLIFNDRSLISPKELDIVIPDLNLAIEYCGLYWHSEFMGKDKYYHINKLERCKYKGYRLITIFEDEWLVKNEIVKSRLKSIFNKIDNIIYANKCDIKLIDISEARKFCEANHLQGYGFGSYIRLGGFYNNELVAVMTFSKPSLTNGIKTEEDGVYELYRFCTKIDTTVVGIVSKLFKFFINNYEYTTIYSYADRRWSDGDIYDRLGFYKEGCLTEPNCWYFKNNLKRIRFRKTYAFESTERELMSSESYNIIWDCGNFKYIFN